jgi:ADP-heptose:LPS heptosyltransferase
VAHPPYAGLIRGRERYLLRTRILEPLRSATQGLAGHAWRSLRHRGAPGEIGALRRLLVIHRIRIGDAIMMTPLLRALRERFPEAAITLLVSPVVAGLMRRAPGPDRVIAFEPGKGEGARGAAARAAREAGPADGAFVLDFTTLSARIAERAGARFRIGYDDHGRGWRLTHAVRWPPEWNRAMADYGPETAPRHQAERWLELGALVGASTSDAQPRLEAHGSQGWDDLLPAAGLSEDSRVLVIHPGSDPAYRWRAERWGTVVGTLVERHGFQVILSGGPEDGPVVAELRSVLKREAPDILHAGLVRALDVAARADLLLTVDTCLGHLASAVGTPAVVLMGPSDPRIWRPYGQPHVVLRDPEERCGGCKQPRCPLREHLCMDGITVEAVLRGAEEALARAGPGVRRDG